MHPRRRAHARERRSRRRCGRRRCRGRRSRPASALPGRPVFAKRRRPGSCRLSARHSVVRARGRVVDVEVRDTRRRERTGAPAPRVAGVRPVNGSTWIATRRPAVRADRCTRGSRAASAEPGPHHETITVWMPTDAISLHLRADDLGSADEYGPRAREPVRGDLASEARCRSAASAPRRRRRPRCRTTGSRRSRPRRRRQPPGLPGLAMPGAGSAKCERRERHRRSQGHPRVLRNSRETLTGRQDEWKRGPSTRHGDVDPARKRPPWPRRLLLHFRACASAVIVLSFVLGLAATTAAVALATGPATSRRGGEVRHERRPAARRQLRQQLRLQPPRPGRSDRLPGRPGASHDHTFLGSKTTDAYSTDATLRAAATTCKRRGETAAYWVPTLVSGAQAVVPAAASAYYRRDTIENVKPFPPGLRMIAGSSVATTPQPLSVTRWDCGIEAHVRGLERPAHVPARPTHGVAPPRQLPGLLGRPEPRQRPTTTRTWPTTSQGNCPPSHPVAVPALELILRYPVLKGPSC